MIASMPRPTDETAEESPVLGDEIKRLREESGRGQQVFATNADIGMSTLRRAEASDPGVTYRNMVKIARELGVDISTIYREAQPTGQAPAPIAPAWAVQQFEQLSTALADVRKTLERMEAAQQSMAMHIEVMSR